MDIEDVVTKAKCYQQCPYYACRNASNFAQLVILPYQYLLSEEARNSMSIELENSIVIIDEAHNLINTLESSNSCKIFQNQLMSVKSCVDKFLQTRETDYEVIAKTSQLKMICDSLLTFLPSKECVSVSEFISRFHLENINIVKLDEFCKNFQFVTSLIKYFSKIQTNGSPQCIYTFINIISCLRNSSPSDKLIVDSNNSITFFCLDSAAKFRKLTTGCRSIIIVGGTLEPLSEFQDFFQAAHFDISKIYTFSFDHIVPSKNLLSLVMKTGPSERELTWSFLNKDDEIMISELCRMLFNIYTFIPAGLICFYPSYKMLAKFVEVLKTSGLFSKINQNKKVQNF
ncbi:ATP-dependent RNA helicase CHL1 [Thelohanellus kitauei]|uniref:ATP-dependent RNA helicase CHL1 n=1 Tax=Thelohanellus kitauei TaxID=669202 RepID=A0A0C2N5R0_THEKT|nr:ATP-dependent RNA helicase CHL1 [Thelohanellus kitauei]